MFSSSFKKNIKWFSIFIIVYSLVFFVFSYTLKYTLPFVMAAILSLWVKPFYDYLKKKFKCSNRTSALLSTILIFTVIFIILSIIIYKTILESKDLLMAIPKITIPADSLMESIKKFKPYYEKIDPSLEQKINQQIISLSSKIFELTQSLLKQILSFALKLPTVFTVIFVTFFATYFFLKDMTNFKNKLMSAFSVKWSKKIGRLFREANKMFISYLRSYLFILFLTFLQTFIGFSALGIKYSLLLSLVCAVFDILPILGPAGVYMPVAAYYFFTKKYTFSIIVIILYLVVTIVRQIIEPKIVSSSLGLHPISTLIAIFIGIKADGIRGMLYLIFLMVFYKVFKSAGAEEEKIKIEESKNES